MSSVNYSLKHKGLKLISVGDAWGKGKNGKLKLNSKYFFAVKIDIKMPHFIISASDRCKPYLTDIDKICWQLFDNFLNG